MNKLCGFSEIMAVDQVFYWKTIFYGNDPAGEIIFQEEELTQAGYENKVPLHGLDCSIQEQTLPKDDTDWRWWPYKKEYH